MFIKLLFIIILLFILLFILVKNYNINRNNHNICNKNLTDKEFLLHMIEHHEVAVYMSEQHLNNTNNPVILNILRNIIRIQNFEINMMKDALINYDETKIFDEMSYNNIKMNKFYYSTQGDYAKPNQINISNTFCDSSFFNITKHLHKMTDQGYIKHMIPHHQIAIDMSKKILKSTNNDFIIYLAYRIIRAQQSEIYELNNLLNSKYLHYSYIL